MSDEATGTGIKFSRKASIIAADVADESVLLDIDSGMFFQLNTSAARIWQFLEQPRSIAEIHAAMAEQFEVDAETCGTDVEAFVAQMQDQGLLENVTAG